MKEDSRLRILLLCICLAATLATAGWLASRPETASDFPQSYGYSTGLSAGTASARGSAAAPPEDAFPASSPAGFQPAVPEYRPGALSRPSSSPVYSRPVPSSPEGPAASRVSSGRESSRFASSRQSRPERPSAPEIPSRQESGLSSSLSSREESGGVSSVPSVEEIPSADSSAPSGPPVSSADTAGLRRENDGRAAALESRTGVAVLLLREWGTAWDRLLSAPAHDEAALSAALGLLENVLFPYENGILSREGVTVCIAGGLSGGEKYYAEARLLLLSCGVNFAAAARDFLFDTACAALPTGAGIGISSLVPEGFLYGFPEEGYVYSPRNPLYGWFLSLEAQESPEADFRALLRAYLETPSLFTQIPRDSPLRQRVPVFLEELRDAFPVLRE